MESNAAPAKTFDRSPARVPAFAGTLLFFLLVASLRLFLIHCYGNALPYSDQWDAEGWNWLRPLHLGGVDWRVLFAAHNEHRIALVRITSLLFFAANDQQWDNLVSSTFNAFFVAAASALAFRAIQKNVARGAWLLSLFLLAACCLPCAYENLLVGFQAQFYFLIALTVAGVWLAASRPVGFALTLCLGLIAYASLFSIASGLFTPVSIAIAVILRRRIDQSSWRSCLPLLGILTSSVVVGSLLLVPVPYHEALHAQNLAEWITVVIKAGSWPLPASWFCFAITWLPALIGVIATIRRRLVDAPDLAAAALAAWTALQIASITYGRGHDMAVIASRYTDLLAMSVLVNVHFCLRLLPAAINSERARRLRLGVWLWLVTIAAAYAGQGLVGFVAMTQFSGWREVQADNVHAYIMDARSVLLDRAHPWLVPYHDRRRLKMMLDDAAIRDILPACVRAPLSFTRTFHDGFDQSPDPGANSVPTDGRTASVSVHTQHVDDLHSRFPYLLVPISGQFNELTLELASEDGRTHEVVGPVTGPAHAVVARVPADDFSMRASAIGASPAFSLQPPAELGRLSRVTKWLLDVSSVLLGTGIAATVLSALYGWMLARRRASPLFPAAPGAPTTRSHP